MVSIEIEQLKKEPSNPVGGFLAIPLLIVVAIVLYCAFNRPAPKAKPAYVPISVAPN